MSSGLLTTDREMTCHATGTMPSHGGSVPSAPTLELAEGQRSRRLALAAVALVLVPRRRPFETESAVGESADVGIAASRRQWIRRLTGCPSCRSVHDPTGRAGRCRRRARIGPRAGPLRARARCRRDDRRPAPRRAFRRRRQAVRSRRYRRSHATRGASVRPGYAPRATSGCCAASGWRSRRTSTRPGREIQMCIFSGASVSGAYRNSKVRPTSPRDIPVSVM